MLKLQAWRRWVVDQTSRLVTCFVGGVLREPRREVWGLEEMWIADPDEVRIVLVEIPEDHPLRRDRRHLAAGHE